MLLDFGGVIIVKNIQYMPDNPVYGIAYVPYSKFDDLYPVCKAIERGTMFKVLDIPFSSYANVDIMNPFRSKC